MLAVDGSGVPLEPLSGPTLLDSGAVLPAMPEHLRLTPEQCLYVYSDKQWEEFVLEWATSLLPNYEQVMRSGGGNDHGVDVAGFMTPSRFEGLWDCYQCKHYQTALKISDAFPEILKIVGGAIAGYFTWPRSYRFAAPKGCSTPLANLLHSSGQLKAEFRAELIKAGSTLARRMGGTPLRQVLQYVDDADFTVFGTVELHELVTGHTTTRWHAARFGTALPPRPAVPAPTREPVATEQRYIEKLVAVYQEKHQDENITAENVAGHPRTSAHYQRQREAFYSAEALRVFARDSVPAGTFADLQTEIYDGVVPVHDQDHENGHTRLQKVIAAAGSVAITSNGLLPVVKVRDRGGICHQLANDDRLDWCHAAPE